MKTLKASPETCAWGYFDATSAPVGEVDSGEVITKHAVVAADANDLRSAREFVTTLRPAA